MAIPGEIAECLKTDMRQFAAPGFVENLLYKGAPDAFLTMIRVNTYLIEVQAFAA